MDREIRPLSGTSHSNFFSSLKQVEKRLKLEQTSLPIESQIQESTLGSPMFLLQPSGSQNCASQDSSEPPQAFLSVSQEFPPTHQDPSQADPGNEAEDDDDIEVLMQLLGLREEQEQRSGFDDGGSCHCEGGFYEKVVGVEGPKCGKEALRLDGWIKHFMSGEGEKQEPLRLAHLLLGKAAFISDDAFGELDFPSTVQEFLHTDPPTN